MFKKFIYVFGGIFATVFVTNIETDFKDGIMNVTLNEAEGLAQRECGTDGYTECPDRGSKLVKCKITDKNTGLSIDGEMDFCMTDGRGCVITPCYNVFP